MKPQRNACDAAGFQTYDLKIISVTDRDHG